MSDHKLTPVLKALKNVLTEMVVVNSDDIPDDLEGRFFEFEEEVRSWTTEICRIIREEKARERKSSESNDD